MIHWLSFVGSRDIFDLLAVEDIASFETVPVSYVFHKNALSNACFLCQSPDTDGQLVCRRLDAANRLPVLDQLLLDKLSLAPVKYPEKRLWMADKQRKKYTVALQRFFEPLTLVTEEGTRDVQLLAADDNDTLTSESLLGNNGGKATQKMALTVDDNHLLKQVE